MTPEEYVTKYQAATSDDERFALIKEALNLWGVSTGVLTAHLMESIESEDWETAGRIVDDLLAGLPLMRMNFLTLHYKKKFGL